MVFSDEYVDIFKVSASFEMGKTEDDGKVNIHFTQPKPPKRALSAFFLYRGEVYNKVKSEHPEAKITEITKIISEMWAQADEATKNRLEEEYKKNKEVAAKEKADYEE